MIHNYGESSIMFLVHSNYRLSIIIPICFKFESKRGETENGKVDWRNGIRFQYKIFKQTTREDIICLNIIMFVI